MDLLILLQHDKSLSKFIATFLEKYGISGLKTALQVYDNNQEMYVFKNKKGIYKIKISDIFYIEILNHNITIHTPTKTYYKYGTLKQELAYLQSYGFVKCNQSMLVPLSKIEFLEHNTVILKDGTKLSLSRTCIDNVLKQYSSHNNP